MRTSFVLLLAVAACGPAAEGPKSPTGGGSGSATKPAAGDATFEVPAIEIKGIAFEPEALGTPGMPLAEPKGQKVPLKGDKLDAQIKKQRTTFTGTKGQVDKEAQAALLATMLYHKSKEVQGAEIQKLLGEARQALRDAAQISGDKVDEITLRLLGSYELILEDYPSAEKAWATLVTRTPKDKDAPFNRAWWAYALLKQYKNTDALAAVKDEPHDDKQPELAYAAAWTKWRVGDEAGAWQAIVAAVKGWKNNPGRDALDRDVLVFAGRTGASLADAIAQLTPIYGKAKDQQYELLAKLGLQAYQYAGRWSEGVAALDRAIEVEGDKVPPNDRPVLRYQQADYTVRLDDPVAAARLAKQGLEALPGCGPKCTDKDKENVAESVYIMGRLFHILYATAHDDRYYQPAHDLYQAAIPLMSMASQATREEALKDQALLEGSFKAMKHDYGTHDKDAIGALLKRHNQEIQACYEQGLAANPKLGGGLTLMLESDQTGVVKGASTEPKAGLADMSAVAGCVVEHAKTWKLPKRANGNGAPGATRIKLGYSLSIRKDAK